MSLSKPNSHYQNVEQSENQRRPLSSHSMLIACRVCDRVFFDNVSLVLHFECHLKDEISIPRQHGQDLASLQSGGQLSLSLSLYPCSSVQRMNETCHVVFPRMDDCCRPCPLPVSSAITPNLTPRDASLVHIPVLNSMPPINSSFDALLNLSQPIHHSVMSPYGTTSSSTHPLMYSQVGARDFVYGSAAAPLLQLQLREQNGGQAHFSDYTNPHISQLEKSIPEIIIISDDEEDDNKNAAEIDLTLKL